WRSESPFTVGFRAYVGFWFHCSPNPGYESLLGTMSAAKISREVGVPIGVVEARQQYLGIAPYRRVSRAERYAHLFGLVPNNVLAKLAGVSHERIADMRRSRGV
ncbi:hypothetical protein QVN01_33995, partial [Pseudomonas aeruginosa]